MYDLTSEKVLELGLIRLAFGLTELGLGLQRVFDYSYYRFSVFSLLHKLSLHTELRHSIFHPQHHKSNSTTS